MRACGLWIDSFPERDNKNLRVFESAKMSVCICTLRRNNQPDAYGVISVIGNAFPREFSRMTRLALQGDFANALTIHHKFTELFSLLFVDGNPAGVKAMLNVMGLIENKLRLPLVPTRITTFEKMRAILNELKIKC